MKIKFTKITNTEGLLNKTFSLDKDTNVMKQSNAFLSNGNAQTINVENLNQKFKTLKKKKIIFLYIVAYIAYIGSKNDGFEKGSLKSNVEAVYRLSNYSYERVRAYASRVKAYHGYNNSDNLGIKGDEALTYEFCSRKNRDELKTILKTKNLGALYV